MARVASTRELHYSAKTPRESEPPLNRRMQQELGKKSRVASTCELHFSAKDPMGAFGEYKKRWTAISLSWAA
jgi:hypothetical protein